MWAVRVAAKGRTQTWTESFYVEATSSTHAREKANKMARKLAKKADRGLKLQFGRPVRLRQSHPEPYHMGVE